LCARIPALLPPPRSRRGRGGRWRKGRPGSPPPPRRRCRKRATGHYVNIARPKGASMRATTGPPRSLKLLPFPRRQRDFA
jgi:hypothetical protein